MRKEATLPELNRTGVAYITRRLAVGDFIWVARENVAPHREGENDSRDEKGEYLAASGR